MNEEAFLTEQTMSRKVSYVWAEQCILKFRQCGWDFPPVKRKCLSRRSFAAGTRPVKSELFSLFTNVLRFQLGSDVELFLVQFLSDTTTVIYSLLHRPVCGLMLQQWESVGSEDPHPEPVMFSCLFPFSPDMAFFF